MKRIFLKSKIHNCIVTDKKLNYEGSLTIDERLLEAADICEFEKVEVYNVSNGYRFSTYIIKGEKNSGIICVNGAACRLCEIGDKLIVVSYTILDENEIKYFKPKIVCIKSEDNKIFELI